MPNFPNLIHYAIPFFIFSILLELVVSYKKQLKTYKSKDAFSSITMGLGNVILGFVSKSLVLGVLFLVYDNLRFFTIPIEWWSFILLFFADDFSY